ncbi:hypothetical protein MNBD_GAMMA09-3239 [hydrothermal vent metagenome]|uniref:Uncharacterized protein n=1 Tax=hydrothermal vent metagenome TaxID=652676 RepID=A0A3B0YJT4_9ZZZZ
MKNSISLVVKVVIMAAIAGAGIIYIFNRSPVEDLGSYEKQEMARPNRSKSVLDQFFSKDRNRQNGSNDDDVSLMGSSGRYDEVRIGKGKDE